MFRRRPRYVGVQPSGCFRLRSGSLKADSNDSINLMRTAVIGSRGQLGGELLQRLGGDAVGLTHDDIEITEPDSVQRALAAARPELVINTAAYNQVDRAEDEPEQAYRVNALGPRNLARWCAGSGAILIHVSTDYVFAGDPGRTRPWTEEDPPAPQSAYAVSKLAGEYFVRSICNRHFVVRTCGLYGGSPGRGSGNFVETMLRLGRERGAVRVVDDQRCCPSFAGDVAEALLELSRTGNWGLYHATNAGSVTWCEYARAVFESAGLDVDVTPITTAEFGAAAKRPAFSVLDCASLEAAIGRAMRPWREALSEYVAVARSRGPGERSQGP